MCIDCDALLTALITASATLIAAWAGAACAFAYNHKLEEDKIRNKELNCIFSYYGYLINLYWGYKATSDSLTSISDSYLIENNLSKVQKANRDWGCLSFIMDKSNTLFENIFILEKDTDVVIEKYIRYSEGAKSDRPHPRARTIALEQFKKVYPEIVAMIYSLNNYADEFYDETLITKEMKEELPSITSLKMEDKERWCLEFNGIIKDA